MNLVNHELFAKFSFTDTPKMYLAHVLTLLTNSFYLRIWFSKNFSMYSNPYFPLIAICDWILENQPKCHTWSFYSPS